VRGRSLGHALLVVLHLGPARAPSARLQSNAGRQPKSDKDQSHLQFRQITQELGTLMMQLRQSKPMPTTVIGALNGISDARMCELSIADDLQAPAIFELVPRRATRWAAPGQSAGSAPAPPIVGFPHRARCLNYGRSFMGLASRAEGFSVDMTPKVPFITDQRCFPTRFTRASPRVATKPVNGKRSQG
jgi:hypothetical protein